MESVANYFNFKVQNFNSENSTLLWSDLKWMPNNILQDNLSVTLSEEKIKTFLSITPSNNKTITSPEKSVPIIASQSKLRVSNLKKTNKLLAKSVKKDDPEKTYNLKNSKLFKNGYNPLTFPQEYYFIVFIIIYLSEKEVYRCTGSLLTSQWVLTAATCFTHSPIFEKNLLVVTQRGNLKEYLKQRSKIVFEKSLFFNGVDIEERRVEILRIHPNFDKVKLFHDVALLKLKEPLRKKITYPKLSNEKMGDKHTRCKIVGFGLLHFSIRLFDAIVRNVSGLTASTPDIGCESPVLPDSVPKEGPFVCFRIKEPMVCSGDPGVPLLCEKQIWAIATKHELKDYLELDDYTCNHEEDEFFFSATYINFDWIKSTMSKALMSAKIEKKWLIGLSCFLFAF